MGKSRGLVDLVDQEHALAGVFVGQPELALVQVARVGTIRGGGVRVRVLGEVQGGEIGIAQVGDRVEVVAQVTRAAVGVDLKR